MVCKIDFILTGRPLETALVSPDKQRPNIPLPQSIPSRRICIGCWSLPYGHQMLYLHTWSSDLSRQLTLANWRPVSRSQQEDNRAHTLSGPLKDLLERLSTCLCTDLCPWSWCCSENLCCGERQVFFFGLRMLWGLTESFHPLPRSSKHRRCILVRILRHLTWYPSQVEIFLLYIMS